MAATGRPLTRTALVCGATGVIGRSILSHLTAQPDWTIVAVSRRKPDIPGTYRHIAVDLLDAEATAAALGQPLGITHVFYASYIERGSFAESGPANVAMLTHLLDAVVPASPALAHINLMQGTKWYGSHLGPFKTPAKESDPRAAPPNFYYDQQDLLSARQHGQPWSWSSARPHATCGYATGNPMNLVMVIAVYASILKALGQPLRHPGSSANANALYQCCDVGLLARACTWMATNPACANEPFNITNGDIFRWNTLWPRFAKYFDMELAAPQPIKLADRMRDKAEVWDQLVQKHELKPIPFAQVAAWGFGDFVFASPYDIISSTMKARRFGFQDSIDSEEMFIRLFDQLRKNRVIP
jgi:nucleoside-diphosphate-sugar epimerase